jgi:hypothetical protein
MPQKRYRVTLTEDKEKALDDILNKGKHGAQKRKLIPGIAPCQRRIYR